jgi:putative endonuclease
MKGDTQDSRKALGNQGEYMAVEYMRSQGYLITAQNWRCRSGEIDIIAEKDGQMIFVEVRARTKTGTYGTPQESVNYRKQKQVRDTARVYIYQHKKFDRLIRFDVISVLFNRDGSFSGLDHLMDAF